jgi:hypothetical protein
MSLGSFGQTGTQENSRVSALLLTNDGKGVKGASVKLYDANTGNLIETRNTDETGLVAFALAFSKQVYILRPEVPKGMLVNPSEKKVVSIPVDSWSAEKSAKFLITTDHGEKFGFQMPSIWTMALIGVGIWLAWPYIDGMIDKLRSNE